MATMTEQIRADLTRAMKDRDALRTSTLRLVQSSFKNEQIAQGHELSDEEAMAVIRKAVKQRQDSIEQYRRGNRDDLAEKEQAEMEILQAYLPKQISEVEIRGMAQEVIALVGAESKKDMGKVMREVMTKLKGQADGRKVQEIVSELLP